MKIDFTPDPPQIDFTPDDAQEPLVSSELAFKDEQPKSLIQNILPDIKENIVGLGSMVKEGAYDMPMRALQTGLQLTSGTPYAQTPSGQQDVTLVQNAPEQVSQMLRPITHPIEYTKEHPISQAMNVGSLFLPMLKSGKIPASVAPSEIKAAVLSNAESKLGAFFSPAKIGETEARVFEATKGKLGRATKADVSSAVENLVKAKEDLVKEYGSLENKAKVQVGIPTTPQEMEASVKSYGNTFGVDTSKPLKPYEPSSKPNAPEMEGKGLIEPLDPKFRLDNPRVHSDAYGIGTEYETPIPKGDTVTVYRSVPIDSSSNLVPGDYVTLSKKYALDHVQLQKDLGSLVENPALLKGSKIISQEIPKTELEVYGANELKWKPQNLPTIDELRGQLGAAPAEVSPEPLKIYVKGIQKGTIDPVTGKRNDIKLYGVKGGTAEEKLATFGDADPGSVTEAQIRKADLPIPGEGFKIGPHNTDTSLANEIARFKKNIDYITPEDRVKVAHYFQDAINSRIDWQSKEAGGVQQLLKLQYGDLKQITTKHSPLLQESKSRFAKLYEATNRVAKILGDPAKAEDSLRKLFTSGTAESQAKIKQLYELESLIGKPIVSELVKMFSAEAFGKWMSRPGLQIAETAHAGAWGAFGHGLMAAAALLPPVIQSPRLMAGLVRTGYKVAPAISSAVNKGATLAGMQAVRQGGFPMNSESMSQLQSLRDRLKNNGK